MLYPYERVARTSHHLAQVIALNPITPILELARRWIIDPHAPYPGTAATGGFGYLIVGFVVAIVICVLAVWLFRREAPRIAEEL